MPNQRSSANLSKISSWAPCVRPIIAYFKCPPSIPNQGLPMAWSICSVNIPCLKQRLSTQAAIQDWCGISYCRLIIYIPMVSSWPPVISLIYPNIVYIYNYIAAEHGNFFSAYQSNIDPAVISKDPTKIPTNWKPTGFPCQLPIQKKLKPTSPEAHLAGHVNAYQLVKSHLSMGDPVPWPTKNHQKLGQPRGRARFTVLGIDHLCTPDTPGWYRAANGDPFALYTKPNDALW